MTWQALLPQQELLTVCRRGVPAAGLSSPSSGSYSSSDSKDPAVAELEQFIMQELAAAGVVVNDSSSATALPMLPAALHPTWHQQCVPQHQHQHQPMHAPAGRLALQQLHQPSLVPLHVQAHWPSGSHATADANLSCMPGAAVAGAAGASWVPARAAGSLAQPGAGSHEQQGVVSAASGSAAASGAVQGEARAHMMARLQERLRSLAAQMSDMQLMLRMLQDA
jgi:hypothetical protein